jgi:plastocyanin
MAGAIPLLLAGAHAFAHAHAEASEVEVRTFAFSSDTLHVEAGMRIRWTNRDAIEHTITWGTPDERDDRLASGTLVSAGATHTATPRAAGRYRYFCDRHQFMRGVVIVTSPGERTNG